MCITEASYTLLLYDELLEWSDRPLREFLNYPMQSEWQRKEYLHLTIIQNFDRGKVSTDIYICMDSNIEMIGELQVDACSSIIHVKLNPI